MYVVAISCFHSILHLKTNVEGARDMNLLLYLLIADLFHQF